MFWHHKTHIYGSKESYYFINIVHNTIIERWMIFPPKLLIIHNSDTVFPNIEWLPFMVFEGLFNSLFISC